MVIDIEQAIVERLRRLPMEEQREVLDFADFLHYRHHRKYPYRGVKGLWSDLNVQISAEEIDEVRRDMWSTFPREDII